MMNANQLRTIPAVVWICLGALPAWPCLATVQDTPQANNPVSLATAPDDIAAEPPVVDADAAAAETGAAPTGRDEGEPPSGARQLGRPTSLFSLGASSVDEHEEASDGLAWLDPRANEFTRVLGAMVVVVGLILLLRFFVQRAAGGLPGGGRPSGVLEVLARYPIARGQTLVLLKLGRRVLLAHQSAGIMATLTEVTEPDEVAALMARIEAGADSKKSGRPGAFGLMLRRFEAAHDRPDGERAFRDWLGNASGGDVVDLTRGPRRRAGRMPS